MDKKQKRFLSNLGLLLCGAIWGGGFVVMKNALDGIDTNYLLAIRFSLAALALSFTLFQKKRRLPKKAVVHAILVGVVIYAAFAVQTYGLALTTAGKNALVTGFYVVLTPFFCWALFKERPDRRMILCALAMLLGIGLLTIEEDLSVNLGDLLTLCCAVLYAIEIIMVDRWTPDVDIFSFTAVQMYASAASAWLVALFVEDFPTVWNMSMVWNLLYCGLVATLLAFVLMNIGIRHADPDYAALFMSTESAFGVFFGVVFLNERMTGRMWAGCILVLLALLISQLKFKKKEGV